MSGVIEQGPAVELSQRSGRPDFAPAGPGAYEAFLRTKSQEGADTGIEPTFMPESLFGFQAFLTSWALRKGRAAVFADCGLGKTPMQLVWAENMARHTGKPTLIAAPLAVSTQTVREGEKFGIEAVRDQHGSSRGAGIVVTNYERLENFDPADFGAVVCDESSILKAFDGTRRKVITDFMRKVPYRLLATATAAPNDYVELGTSSEALGYLGHMDMLTRFFRNDQHNSSTRRFYGEAPQWRFKGHAEDPFWRWVASWARACRRPADIGFPNDGFALPDIETLEHVIATARPRPGHLFSTTAVSLAEQREERRITLAERCQVVADIANQTTEPVLVWCHLNEEAQLLRTLIADGVEISGGDSDERKEGAFQDFIDGRARVLITKPTIGGWGLNFQHCSKVTFFPSHSFEQYYQAVRRCWRYGQRNPVEVHLVMSEGERRVMENLQRKADAAARMFDSLVASMGHASDAEQPRAESREAVPSWL